MEKPKKSGALSQSMAVLFDPALRKALQDLSEASGMSVGRLIRRACCFWLASDDAMTLRVAGEKEADVMRSFLMAASTPEEKAETKKFVKGVK